MKPAVPAPLSAIILKLLAKDADERYQSAYGLQADLEHCRRQLAEHGAIAPFPIAQRDVPDRFALPQKLYGREAELATLLSAFEQVARGDSALLLVAGAPGIGKTALVQEVYRPLTERRGAFSAGKFDQVQRAIPYLAFAQAFRGLVRQLLGEPEAVLNQWRARLTAALGASGQVIVEVIPDLELVIGAQPPVPELGPQEAQNRFVLVFQQFLRVFTRPDHPLVLFLDDLQWADSGSLTLLEQVLGSIEGGYLFVIGAYRDTEVPPGHALWRTLDTLRQAGLAPQTLTLGPLQEASVVDLVRDALHVDAPTAQPLAALVHQKTGGNPFFLGEFLKALCREGLLAFDMAQGRWDWQLPRIEARQMTDNVVQLMIEQMRRLPATTRQVLQSAACIGSRFDLATLMAVTEQAAPVTARQLEPALLAGLIEPLDASYNVAALDVTGLAQVMRVEYRFAHDRIQQAAYEQMPEAERATRHWGIGRLLLASIPAGEREERLFDLVSQLNAGRTLANDEERQELARLNLEAGRKARESAAFAAAYESFQVGIELLPADAWQQHYQLALTLHTVAAEAAYLNGSFDTMQRLVEMVLAQAHSAIDTVKVYETWMQAAIAQARPFDAIRIAREFLATLDVYLPEHPDQAATMQAVHQMQVAMGNRTVESLLDLPVMTDPVSLATMRILVRIYTACYMVAPSLIPIVASNMVTLSLRAGNDTMSGLGYAAYGVIACAVFGAIDTGYRFGKLAMQLVERRHARAIQAAVGYIFNTLIRIWKEHLRVSLPHMLQVYHTGLEIGDFEYAAYGPYGHSLYAFGCGSELGKLAQDIESYYHAIVRLKQLIVTEWHAMLWQCVLNLVQPSEHPYVLEGTACSEHELLARSQGSIDRSRNIFTLFLYKLTLAYLFEHHESIADFASTVEQHRMSNPGTLNAAQACFYAALARLRLYPDTPAAEQPALLEQMAVSQQQLHSWAQHAPMNFLHKWQLIEAERCRVLGDHDAAWGHYQRAAAGAREHGYIQDEALAYELCGRFYLARGQREEAQFYLHRAHHAYARWGAAAKVQQLEARYPDLLVMPADAPQRATPGFTLNPGTCSTTRAATLDVASIVKASQAISGEVQLEALLSRLLHVLLENAGADRGAILLTRDDQWFVEAEGAVEGAVTVRHSRPLAQASLPHSLLSYVRRTRTSVVLDDAPQTGDFTQDAYIQARRPRSVLALPLIHQGALTGLLYLENAQTAGAFTPERQEVLALLSGQVAISLENARLYTHLEELVAERTAQLASALSEAEQARAAAEEANDLKTRFVANMSHELRTPLNAILNFTYIIKSGLRGPVTTGQVEYLDRVYANGEHLLGLINDILDLAKIEAGRMELYTEPLSLAEVVRSTLATASGLTKDKPIELHHEIAADLPGVTADKTRLRQVLLNLLSNAAKFTDAGSITVRVWQEGDALITSIADTGIGIPAEKLETIFEEYRQADEGSARSYQGTGLGLPICKRLVELHGGRLWVESTVGTGSTFYFSLPLAVAPALDATLSLPLPGTEQGAAVLVIDDDPQAIEIVRTYLSREGYAVYGMTDGRAALAEARRLRPAAILLDIILPFANGWNILAELKADPCLYTIPVIMYTVVDAARKGLSLGADGYLLKPVDPQQLLATVMQLAPPAGAILAIDDDPDVLEMVRQQIGSVGGYRVLTASGGQAGLEAIAAQRPDLVLLDLLMPEVDGFAVLEALDQQPETRSIPVVVLSDETVTPDERRYLHSRVDGLLNKQDTAPEQWLAWVRRALRKRMQPPGT